MKLPIQLIPNLNKIFYKECFKTVLKKFGKLLNVQNKEKVPINTYPKMQCICLYVFDFNLIMTT